MVPAKPTPFRTAHPWTWHVVSNTSRMMCSTSLASMDHQPFAVEYLSSWSTAALLELLAAAAGARFVPSDPPAAR